MVGPTHSSGSMSSEHPILSHKRQISSLFSRLVHLPDQKPRLRYVFDIAIIAISILMIVGVLLATQGNGLLLFALIPGFVIGALGITLLVTDIGRISETAKRRADTIAAVIAPFLILAISGALIASAVAISGGSVLVLAHPLFTMGIIGLGLTLMAVNRITAPQLLSGNLSEVKKTQEVSDQTLGAQTREHRDTVLLRRKRFASSAERLARQERREARRRMLARMAQGNLEFLPYEQNEQRATPYAHPRTNMTIARPSFRPIVSDRPHVYPPYRHGIDKHDYCFEHKNAMFPGGPYPRSYWEISGSSSDESHRTSSVSRVGRSQRGERERRGGKDQERNRQRRQKRQKKKK